MKTIRLWIRPGVPDYVPMVRHCGRGIPEGMGGYLVDVEAKSRREAVKVHALSQAEVDVEKDPVRWGLVEQARRRVRRVDAEKGGE